VNDFGLSSSVFDMTRVFVDEILSFSGEIDIRMHIPHIHETIIAHDMEHFNLFSSFHCILPIKAIRQLDKVN
jgi:hypothetical protein